jgi:hypothetical protein
MVFGGGIFKLISRGVVSVRTDRDDATHRFRRGLSIDIDEDVSPDNLALFIDMVAHESPGDELARDMAAEDHEEWKLRKKLGDRGIVA